jgi:hypothetical protein
MANNKLHGYNPDPSKEVDENRLDKFNPYEFRKGMDYELTTMGIARLAESSDDERRKATESVLKNLDEHGGYYTSLITYETKFRNEVEGMKKPSFKQWLSEQDLNKMQEVKAGDKDSKHKSDKMEELKEAIKIEIKNILSEAKKGKEDKEVSDDDTDKKASKGAKGKEKALAALDKEVEKLKAEKDKNKDKLSVPLKRYKDGKLTADEYRKLSDATVKRNKEIIARLDDIKKEKEAISLNEKLGRREVAKTMMEKDTHMAILEIIKEYGISLREGSQGVKAYYEIAKTAYQEGYMEGLQKN